ncbi:SDR family oxidoreductase [Paenibacillus silvisoli]|uniref:SDR family oxidoreductase n=1 Tax=Paenibacillus silvisoli TaxID=3110539 RepID=UPI002804E174|nr:NAD(P)-dependent oxidoreductase [Paenibacillus silvisoli]
MNIFITGAGGQLGRDLLRVLRPTHTCVALNRKKLDICDLRAVQKTVGEAKPDVIIHAAAYSKADQAEEAYRRNALGVSHLAFAAEATGAKLVLVTTDYRFDGTKGESDGKTNRVNSHHIYGQSKLLGEQFVQAVCPRHFIVRTSPAYSHDLAECISRIILTERYGAYHVSNSGYKSRYDFAWSWMQPNPRGGIPFE